MKKVGSFILGFCTLVILNLLQAPFVLLASSLLTTRIYLLSAIINLVVLIVFGLLAVRFRKDIVWSSFLIGLATFIGLGLLWLGACFGIGVGVFSMADYSGQGNYLFFIILAILLPTALVVWLFIKVLRYIRKQ